MIKKISLRNWKSHLNTVLDFSIGTNALVGIMGSGKTSVLDGICFALFGTFPTVQTRKVKLDDIIMKKPIEQDRCEVEVSFELNGSSYFVKRVVEKGKGTTYAEIKQDGKIIESPSSTRVTEVVEKTLKTSYELFSKAIYSEQNALDYFLTIAKGQRMKKIDELLMLDKFEKVRANLVNLMGKISNRKEAKLDSVGRVDVDGLTANLSRIKSDVEKSNQEKDNLQKELMKIAFEKSGLEKEISEIQKVKENFENFMREERAIQARIEEIRKNISTVESFVEGKDKESLKKNLEELFKQISDFESTLTEKQKKYQKFQEDTINAKVELEMLQKEKISRLEKEFDEKSKVKAELEKYKEIIGKGIDKSLEEKTKLLEKINEDFQILKAKILYEQEALIQLDSSEGKCPICESSLDKKRKEFLIKQKRNRISALTKTLDDLAKTKKLNESEVERLMEDTNELTKMLAEVEDFEEIKSELEKSKQLFSSQTKMASRLEKELAHLKDEIIITQNQLKESSEQKNKLENILSRIDEYELSKKRMNEVIFQREEITRSIKEIEGSLKDRQISEREIWLRNTIAKEREIETKIYAIEQLTKEKEVRMNEFQTILEDLLREKSEAMMLENLERNLNVLHFALEKTQETLRKEFVVSVNFYMNKLWEALYPYQDFVGIKLAIEEGDYVLQLQERTGRWVNVEGVASGGERSIAALALRIAFALVLAPQLRWLVLDEPTHNLDSKAVEDLAITLRDNIGEFIDQVFLITHDEKLEDAVTGSLYIFKREKEKDGFTQVVKIS